MDLGPTIYFYIAINTFENHGLNSGYVPGVWRTKLFERWSWHRTITTVEAVYNLFPTVAHWRQILSPGISSTYLFRPHVFISCIKVNCDVFSGEVDFGKTGRDWVHSVFSSWPEYWVFEPAVMDPESSTAAFPHSFKITRNSLVISTSSPLKGMGKN